MKVKAVGKALDEVRRLSARSAPAVMFSLADQVVDMKTLMYELVSERRAVGTAAHENLWDVVRHGAPEILDALDGEMRAELADAFEAWWDPATNPALLEDPVLVRAQLYTRPVRMDAFHAGMSDSWAEYILPAAAAQGWNARGTKVISSIEEMMATEEADTALGLWTPGSGDEWSKWEYARATAEAL